MDIKINIKFATSWNELNQKQLEEISYALEEYSRFLYCHPEEARPAEYARLYIKLIKNLLRTNNFIKVLIVLRQIPPAEYKPFVKFLLDDISRTIFIPAFKIKGTRYHPPLSRLQNITINEFSLADWAYYTWRKTGDTRYLDILCAILYRPQGGTELDIRKPFNKILIEREVPKFKKVRLKKKIAIAFIYQGCRNHIIKQFPHVFPKPPEQDPDDKTPREEQKYTPFGQLLMYKIKFDTSKLEQTQQLNAYEFLGMYENELKEQKKSK